MPWAWLYEPDLKIKQDSKTVLFIIMPTHFFLNGLKLYPNGMATLKQSQNLFKAGLVKEHFRPVLQVLSK